METNAVMFKVVVFFILILKDASLNLLCIYSVKVVSEM